MIFHTQTRQSYLTGYYITALIHRRTVYHIPGHLHAAHDSMRDYHLFVETKREI